MIESSFGRFPQKTPERTDGIVPRHGSSEEIPLSEELYDVAEIAGSLSPEELKHKLIEVVERVSDLEKKSRTDELTGLLNRSGFREGVERLEAIFMRERLSKRIDVSTALLMIDLDGFKEVNDACGHAGGNRCLQLIAEQVRDTLRESDIFGRIGGDEFSIFLSQDNENGAVRVAEKVRGVIEGVVTDTIHREFPNYTGKLSASIGIVASDGKGAIDGTNTMAIEKVLQYADYAAYVVKASGKRGELTLEDARDIDTNGQYQRDFLAGKTLSR